MGLTLLRQAAATILAAFALATPSAVTLWLSTPSTDDVQARVHALASKYRVVVLQDHELPPVLVQAIVATEDERFYQHHGVDSLGAARAILYDITNLCLCQGGSTITEQLIKEVYLGGSDRGYNKVVDIVLALKVERVLTKQQIMADYLSVITTGYGKHGMSEAACAYFQAPLGNLSIGQYALLAGVAQAPSAYDPTVSAELARQRRAQVLNAMVSERYITEDEATAAKAEPVLAVGTHPGSCLGAAA